MLHSNMRYIDSYYNQRVLLMGNNRWPLFSELREAIFAKLCLNKDPLVEDEIFNKIFDAILSFMRKRYPSYDAYSRLNTSTANLITNAIMSAIVYLVPICEKVNPIALQEWESSYADLLKAEANGDYIDPDFKKTTAEMITKLKTAMAAKADYIIISSGDPAGFAPIIKRAMSDVFGLINVLRASCAYPGSIFSCRADLERLADNLCLAHSASVVDYLSVTLNDTRLPQIKRPLIIMYVNEDVEYIDDTGGVYPTQIAIILSTVARLHMGSNNGMTITSQSSSVHDDTTEKLAGIINAFNFSCVDYHISSRRRYERGKSITFNEYIIKRAMERIKNHNAAVVLLNTNPIDHRPLDNTVIPAQILAMNPDIIKLQINTGNIKCPADIICDLINECHDKLKKIEERNAASREQQDSQ